ncbi:hypothetical protein Z042_10600 [Chania multitudinisentens RB-25]|uniref:Fimbrial-type adhesion domain-containing protein n=1 Tax=Chania multitudinisentens RB-25 TaxID=1441930 RepID=W0LJY5_9GAMM|nr:fimbrial protein [Chania multitudinisentens]AHG22744.1 hypothetical protein Z042_10600 [Chania multitudinisentens RB-25]
MKQQIYALIILAASGVAFTAQGVDGNIHVTAKFVTPACNLQANSKDMTVPLGDVSSSELKTSGAVSATTAFSLKLTDCAAYTAVYISFDGVAAENHDKVFALDDQGQSSTASGIGLEILSNGEAMPVGSALNGAYTGSGDTTFNYAARYKALENNTQSGNANVTVQYNVVYK